MEMETNRKQLKNTIGKESFQIAVSARRQIAWLHTVESDWRHWGDTKEAALELRPE